jgi:hypothetical protein
MTASRSPLFDAVYANRFDSASALIDAGADVSMVDCGRTVLNVAAEYSTAKMVRLLLDAGASVSATDHNGRTPLHSVALYSNDTDDKIVIASMLLAAGADVSMVDWHGRTALHVAAQQSTAKMVQLLLDAGASVSATDVFGETPLHSVMLQDDHADVHLAIASMLLAACADVRAVTIELETPLLSLGVSASSGDMPTSVPTHVVSLMAKHGADVCARNADGQSFLSLYLRTFLRDRITHFLEDGIDIDKFGIDEFGVEWIEMEVEWFRENGVALRKLLNLLLDKGTSSSRRFFREEAEEVMKRTCSKELVRVLFEFGVAPCNTEVVNAVSRMIVADVVQYKMTVEKEIEQQKQALQMLTVVFAHAEARARHTCAQAPPS